MRREMTPSAKAHHTAKWARTMTKWLITYSRKRGARWRLVEFGGPTGSESAGVVDMIAIRKNHRHAAEGAKRGDLFEIVLIQTKGGLAKRPSHDDVARLKAVASHHHAKDVVLATWHRGNKPRLERLEWDEWVPASTHEIFG